MDPLVCDIGSRGGGDWLGAQERLAVVHPVSVLVVPVLADPLAWAALRICSSLGPPKSDCEALHSAVEC